MAYGITTFPEVTGGGFERVLYGFGFVGLNFKELLLTYLNKSELPKLERLNII